MAEELKNSEEESNATDSDKNWKETKKVELYENKIAEFEAKERTGIFTQAGLDTSKGVGKAVEMMYEGDLTVEGIQAYASEEFGVEFGQQGGIQDTGQQKVQQQEQSQERLNNIQNNQVVDIYSEDVVGQFVRLKNQEMSEIQ